MRVCVCLISGQYNSNIVDDSSDILHASVFETKGEIVNNMRMPTSSCLPMWKCFRVVHRESCTRASYSPWHSIHIRSLQRHMFTCNVEMLVLQCCQCWNIVWTFMIKVVTYPAYCIEFGTGYPPKYMIVCILECEWFFNEPYTPTRTSVLSVHAS